MQTHTRLILGLAALVLGLFLGGIGIFEVPIFGEGLSFPLAMLGLPFWPLAFTSFSLYCKIGRKRAEIY